MSPRLNRAEFWLLTTAAEFRIPLRMLGLSDGDEPWHDHLEVTLNKRGHGQSVRHLAVALRRMNARGWIDFQKLREPPSQAMPTDVESAICEPGKFSEGWYYGLTPAGAGTWEAFARPDWQRFVEDDDESDSDRIYVRTIRTASERRLHRYLAAVAHDTEIEPDSREVHTIAPWQVTYWKTLPMALQCTFRCRRKLGERCGPSASWLRSRWCDWL